MTITYHILNVRKNVIKKIRKWPREREREDRKDIVLERNLHVFHDKYEDFVLPETFDRIVRPLFIDETATHAIIDAAIVAKREYKDQLRSLNEGHMAKAEAKAEIGT